MPIDPKDIKKLSVLIPCYNEEDNITEVVDRVAAVDTGLDLEIIVVDDGSTDRTVEILHELEKKYPGIVKVHVSDVNTGKGYAIRIALTYVTGQIVIIQDADLEYDPEDYPKILAPILSGEADVVYGSRFLGKPRPEGMKFMNLVANRMLAFFATLLYGKHLTDEATCYKVFRRDVLDSITLTCQRFEFCPEVTSKVLKKKYRLIEVPINYRGRTTLEGKKINWIDGVEAFWTLLKYRFKN
jgi:dolichol-phosphate mannosyltransferase